MKKYYIYLATLFFGISATAQTYNVTFRVDLGSGTANANGVHIAGSFQGWDPSSTSLSQVGTSSIYETTLAVSQGKLEYKFINGNVWGDDESVPAEVSVGTNSNGNRWAVISQDTVLPAVLFAGSAPAGMKAIQFKVDMSLQSLSTDSIHIVGSFQGLNPSKTMMVNFDGVHRYIAYFNPGDSVYFKFVNGNDWSSVELVPTSCQASSVGISQGDFRFYTDATSGIYEVCYAMCGPCLVVPTHDITINVDLSSLIACSSIDSVTLAGPINGWGGELMSDLDNDGIYTITYLAVDSGDFEYKARYHTSGATNWEGGGNKIIAVSSDSIVATRCFGKDNYVPCATIPPTADVSFIVDFTQASFTPADTIYLMGNFTQWNSNAIAMVPHSAVGQYITTLTQYCPGSMEYRFSNGDPMTLANHEPVPIYCGVDNGIGGFNRFFERTGVPDTVRHIFGACSFINVIENTLDEVSINPNPMTDIATITLGYQDFYKVQVFDITGRIISTMNSVKGNVELNSSLMKGGMYFVKVVNSQGAVKTIKIIVE